MVDLMNLIVVDVTLLKIPSRYPLAILQLLPPRSRVLVKLTLPLLYLSFWQCHRVLVVLVNSALSWLLVLSAVNMPGADLCWQ